VLFQYVAMTKDERNTADGCFSTACFLQLHRHAERQLPFLFGLARRGKIFRELCFPVSVPSDKCQIPAELNHRDAAGWRRVAKYFANFVSQSLSPVTSAKSLQS